MTEPKDEIRVEHERLLAQEIPDIETILELEKLLYSGPWPVAA